jgi:hypothetical protein
MIGTGALAGEAIAGRAAPAMPANERSVAAAEAPVLRPGGDAAVTAKRDGRTRARWP